MYYKIKQETIIGENSVGNIYKSEESGSRLLKRQLIIIM